MQVYPAYVTQIREMISMTGIQLPDISSLSIKIPYLDILIGYQIQILSMYSRLTGY